MEEICVKSYVRYRHTFSLSLTGTGVKCPSRHIPLRRNRAFLYFMSVEDCLARLHAGYAVFSLGIGMAEAVILDRSRGARDACGPQLWQPMVLLCFLRMVYFTSVVVRRAGVLSEPAVVSWVLLGFVQLLLPWIFFSWVKIVTDSDCFRFWREEFPDLWNVVTVEVCVVLCLTFVVGFVVLALFLRSQRHRGPPLTATDDFPEA